MKGSCLVMENQVKANKDNDLKNRSGLYDPEKDLKEEELKESGNQQQSSELQYFTE